MIWTQEIKCYSPGGFGGGGGVPGRFKFNGLPGGGGGVPGAGKPALVLLRTGLRFFLNGFIFFKPAPAFLSTSPGGGGGGGGPCAFTTFVACTKPKDSTPAAIYLNTFLAFFLLDDCIAVVFLFKQYNYNRFLPVLLQPSFPLLKKVGGSDLTEPPGIYTILFFR